MATQNSNINVDINVRAKGTNSLDALNSKVTGFRKNIGGLRFVLGSLGITFGAVFSGAIVRGFITQQEKLSNSLARTRFSLAGLGGDIDKNLKTFRAFGLEMERTGQGAATLATEVGAKLFAALGNEEKALRATTAFLVGHKIKLFDATAAANAFASSTDEDTSSFRSFLSALGVANDDFQSLDTLMENFIRRNEEAAKGTTEFSKQWTIFVGKIKAGAEAIGKAFADALTPMLAFFNEFPQSQQEAFDKSSQGSQQFFDDFANIFDDTKTIESGFGKFMIGIGNLFLGMSLFILDKGSALMIGLATFFLEGLLSLDQLTGGHLTRLGNFFIKFFKGTITFAKGFWRVMIAVWIFSVEKLANIIFKFTQGFRFLFETVISIVKTIWVTFWNGMANFTERAKQIILGIFQKIVDGIKSRVETILNFITRARAAASKPITVVTNFVQKISRVFTGGNTNQVGGAVFPGQASLVGERGPELFVPETRGKIVPNKGLGGGGETTIIITGNTFMTDEEGANKIGDLLIKRLSKVHRFGLST